MPLTTRESIMQLQLELKDTQGRLDALSFIARMILESAKLQDKEAYQALKTACLTYSQDHLATLGEIGAALEEQAQAFTEEIESLFFDKEDLLDEE